MITVGFDFGTHQTKICYEKIEAGTTFYEVLRFRRPNGDEALTLPSIVRLQPNGLLAYGHDATSNSDEGQLVTYFKQKMFSWSLDEQARVTAERWSVLFLAFVIFHLDIHFKNTEYVIQMGMPTDAEPIHYDFCKRQAIKVMASAILLARTLFKGELNNYLNAPYSQLEELTGKCLSIIPYDLREVRKKMPIFVFPEAYASLIPLIQACRLPSGGINLFVDIGGGTVDISLFTSSLSNIDGHNRPHLYYFTSVPFGLNMISGQDINNCHNVEVNDGQITGEACDSFRDKMTETVNDMMGILKQQYLSEELYLVMPFLNFCAQAFDGRPVCYSGGGSAFERLRLAVKGNPPGAPYKFSSVSSVPQLMDHSKLGVDDQMFYVLATAFALSHQSLAQRNGNAEPDTIKLVSLKDLYSGVRIPSYVTELGTGHRPNRL